jgi:hypothetical protein
MNDDTAVIVIRPANLEKCMNILENYKNELSGNDPSYQL